MSNMANATLESGSHAVFATPPVLARILVIDDEELVGNTLTAMLGAEGFEAVAARGGKEGVETLRNGPFEVALVDLVMAGMDGIRTIEALKRIDPKIEVILLTGHATVNSTVAAMREGAGDVLLKPAGMKQIRPAISRALSKRRSNSALPGNGVAKKANESEEKLQVIFEGVETGIFLIDPETHRILEANPLALKLVEADHEHVVGAVCHKFVCPAEKGRCPFTDLGQKVDNSERVLLTATGKRLPIIKTVRRVVIGGRELLLESFFDISARKQAEDALRVSEERYRDWVESSPLMIGTHDAQGRILDVNRAAANYLESPSAEALVGRPLADFVPPDLLGRFADYLKAILTEGHAEGLMVLLSPSGKRKVIEFRNTLRRQEGEEPIIRWTAQDVTVRIEAEEALKISENRYRHLFERNLAGVLRCTREGRILDCNESLARMLGYESLQELLGGDVRRIWQDPADREKLVARLRESRTLSNYEVRFQRKDGEPICALLNIQDPGTKAGEAPSFEGTVVDITQRKQAEEKLLLTQFSIEHASDAITWLDEDGRIIYVNDEACRSLERSREELLSCSITDINPTFQPGDWQKEWERMRGVGSDRFEARHITKLGRIIPVEVTANYQEFGGRQYLFTFARDISERKEAERQISLQVTALEAAANGILITDQNARILWANPAFTSLMGYETDEVVGKSPRMFKSGNQAKGFYKNLWRTILAGEVWQGELINRRKDGTLYFEEMTITPVRGDNGAITHFVAIKQDITGRKRAEEAMAERHRLASLIAEVGAALGAAETKRQGLQTSAEILVRNIDAAFARVWTVNEEEKVLELQASAGMYTRLDGSHARVPVGKFKIGRIAECGEPHVTNSVWDDPWGGDSEWARREGMVAFAGFPLKVEGRVFGVLAAFARQPLTEATAQALASVAGNIAQFIRRKRAEKALRESEERHRRLFENNLAGVFRSDAEGKILDCNPALAAMLGCNSPQEVMAMRAQDFYFADDERASFLDRVKAGGDLADFAMRLRRKDGSPKWVIANVHLTAQTEADSQILEGIFVDITERKQAEEALARERDLLRALMESVPDYIYFKDRESRFLRVNAALTKRFGFSDPDQAVGKTDFDFYAPDHAQLACDDEQEVMRSGIPLVAKEEQETWPDGRVTWASTTKVPFRDTGGNIIGTFGVSRDVTERNRFEAEIFQSRQMLQSILDNIPQRVFWKDRNLTYLGCNWAFARDAGLPSPAAIVGRSDFDMAWKGSAEDYRSDDRNIMEQESPRLSFEERQSRPDGSLLWLRTNKLPLRDREGKVIGVIGTYEDITAHKLVEKALRDNEEKYRALFESSQDAIVLFGRETCRFTAGNPAAVAMFGAKDEQALMDANPWNVSPEYQPDGEPSSAKAQKVIDAAMTTGSNSFEWIHKKLGGEEFFATVTLTRVIYRGQPIIQSTIRDITARKRAEEELLFKTALFEAESETSIDGILVVDDTDRIVLANKQFGLHFGIPSDVLRTNDDIEVRQFVIDKVQNPSAFIERIEYLNRNADEKDQGRTLP